SSLSCIYKIPNAGHSHRRASNSRCMSHAFPFAKGYVASPEETEASASSSSRAPRELIMGKRTGAIARVNRSTRLQTEPPSSPAPTAVRHGFRFYVETEGVLEWIEPSRISQNGLEP